MGPHEDTLAAAAGRAIGIAAILTASVVATVGGLAAVGYKLLVRDIGKAIDNIGDIEWGEP